MGSKKNVTARQKAGLEKQMKERGAWCGVCRCLHFVDVTRGHLTMEGGRFFSDPRAPSRSESARIWARDHREDRSRPSIQHRYLKVEAAEQAKEDKAGGNDRREDRGRGPRRVRGAAEKHKAETHGLIKQYQSKGSATSSRRGSRPRKKRPKLLPTPELSRNERSSSDS